MEYGSFYLFSKENRVPAPKSSERIHAQSDRILQALDAASPLFEGNGFYPNKGVVQFLEAVHTSSGNEILKGKLGLEANYGHVDYYPNGGRDQPGCSCEFHEVSFSDDSFLNPHGFVGLRTSILQELRKTQKRCAVSDSDEFFSGS